MSIPRFIHQTTKHLLSLQPEIQDNIKHLRQGNKNWNHRVYDDREVRRYLREHISAEEFRQVERVNPKYGVVLADLFRYVVIYNEGGVYLDIKSTCGPPLDSILPPTVTYILSQWRNRKGEEFEGYGLFPELGDPKHGGEFQQWHIIARPRHPFLKATIERTLVNIRNYSIEKFGVGFSGVLRVSGPICYTKSVLSIWKSDIDYQRADIQKLGFRYSVFRKPKLHRENSLHYSKQSEPIVLD